MQLGDIHRLFDEADDVGIMSFEGPCHKCKSDTVVEISLKDSGFCITGGAIYQPKNYTEQEYFLKCQKCYDKSSTLRDFQPAEVYSRVVGYLRPVKQWNPGKEAEYRDRTSMNLGPDGVKP